MTDSRIEKMHTINRMKPDINASFIYQCESAGLSVIDPDDPPTIEAAARRMHAIDGNAEPWEEDMKIIRQGYLDLARAALHVERKKR